MEESPMKSCPKCKLEIELNAVECPRCGIIFEKYLAIQARKLQEQKFGNETPQLNTYEQQHHDESDRKSPLFAIVCTIVVVAICFAGYTAYAKKKKQDQLNKFDHELGPICSELVAMAKASEDVIIYIHKAWKDEIYEKKAGKSNINAALALAVLVKRQKISKIKEHSQKIRLKIKQIIPPEEREFKYQRLKVLFLIFAEYGDLATNPSGSLLTYSQRSKEVSVKVVSGIRELNMM